MEVELRAISHHSVSSVVAALWIGKIENVVSQIYKVCLLIYKISNICFAFVCATSEKKNKSLWEK